MTSYFLRLSNREEGPYSEEQASQLFADGRVYRHTPCRLGSGGDWKTVDDFLPMLKYGTQLPNPSASVVRSEEPGIYGTRASSPPPHVPEAHRIALVDIDLPFISILKLMFKWMAAGFLVFCCFIPVLMILLFVVMAVFGSLLGHLFSGFPRP